VWQPRGAVPPRARGLPAIATSHRSPPAPATMPNSDAIRRTPEPTSEPGWKLRLKKRLGMLDSIELAVYRAFGTPDLLHIWGRVVEQKGLEGSAEPASVFRNALSTLHRLRSREVPGARIRATYAGHVVETRSDEEGYFVVDVRPDEDLAGGWHEVDLELLESIGEPAERHHRERVLIPKPDAEFGIISDVDDTIVESHSTDFLQELAIIFGQGPHDRIAFPGVPALYRALQRGPDDQGENPIFYVSRSGWNLYDLLEGFMKINEIPEGPLFLSDLRLIEAKSSVMGDDQHKYDNIDLLLRVYPELPFVLIGDSGMHDPELYRQVVRQHPGRIKAIYIHDVSEERRDEEVRRIAEDLADQGVPLVHKEDTIDAAEHACREGLISRRGLEEVREESRRQKERRPGTT
jgi:phosphatidate phosphatase APP1